MTCGVIFRNGIGNFIIFSSILQALQYHNQGKVDLLLNQEWIGESKDAVVAIANNINGVNVINISSDYDLSNYSFVYLSTHSVYDALYKKIHEVNGIDIDRHAFWSHDFISEYSFYYLELMREIGYKGPKFPQYMPYDESLVIKDEGLRICIANGYQRGSTGVFKRKQYPHFAQVMKMIEKLYGNVTFYILGGKDDKGWAEELSKEVKCKDYTGSLNILQTASVIKQSDMIIANDSSLAHIADSLMVPGIVLMGSTLCSKNAPLNGTIIPIMSPLACAPCQRTFLFSMCAEDNRCMESISPAYVLAATRKILKEILW